MGSNELNERQQKRRNSSKRSHRRTTSGDSASYFIPGITGKARCLAPAGSNGDDDHNDNHNNGDNMEKDQTVRACSNNKTKDKKKKRTNRKDKPTTKTVATEGEEHNAGVIGTSRTRSPRRGRISRKVSSMSSSSSSRSPPPQSSSASSKTGRSSVSVKSSSSSSVLSGSSLSPKRRHRKTSQKQTFFIPGINGPARCLVDEDSDEVDEADVGNGQFSWKLDGLTIGDSTDCPSLAASSISTSTHTRESQRSWNLRKNLSSIRDILDDSTK